MIAGTITGVVYYNPNTQSYQASPCTVQPGTGIQIVVTAANGSDAAQNLGLSCDIIDPSGNKNSTPVAYSPSPIAPGGTTTFGLAFMAGQVVGTWRVTLHLLIAGTEVDTKTYDAVYVQAPAAAPTTTTSTIDLSPLINMMVPLMTLMMVMAMIQPMMKSMSKGFGGEQDEEA